jgi:hypothetical protein
VVTRALLLTRARQAVIALVAAYAAKVMLLPERKKQARAPAASTPAPRRMTERAACAELSGVQGCRAFRALARWLLRNARCTLRRVARLK